MDKCDEWDFNPKSPKIIQTSPGKFEVEKSRPAPVSGDILDTDTPEDIVESIRRGLDDDEDHIASTAPVSGDMVKHMVSRFLNWKLPENFAPDAGICFEPTFNKGTPYEMKHTPTGTNLFNATQAEAMVRYMLEGIGDE